MVSPKSAVKYVLSQFQELPAEEQPHLWLKYISRNERIEIDRLFSEADKINTDAYFAKVATGVKIALVGWSGYSVPYDELTPIEAVLSDGDLAELRLLMVETITLSEQVKKNSWLSVRYKQESSANDAATTVTDASPQKPPSSSPSPV